MPEGGTDKTVDRRRNEAAPCEEASGKAFCDGHLQRGGNRASDFYYHFKDKYDLMAWIFCQQSMKTDVLSVESAAKAMNGMRQDYIFFKRAFEDNSQSPIGFSDE